MKEVFTFSFSRRLYGIRYPLLIAVALSLVLAWVRPSLDSWKLWVPAAFILFMLVRVFQFMRGGANAVTVTDEGLTRSGRTAEFKSASLELRVPLGPGEPEVVELVLWLPPDPKGNRLGVGFDRSLDDFERAVREVMGRVPEARVTVSAPGAEDVRDERREKVLSRYRKAPSAAIRALASLGKPSIAPPKK